MIIRHTPKSGHRFSNRIEPLEQRIAPATFIVTTAADSGAGSLRQAILSANGTAGADLITFNLGTGPFKIQPLTQLPDITEAVTIDGYSQSGASVNSMVDGTNANIIVELSGESLGFGNGLVLGGSGGSIVRGLAIFGFKPGINDSGNAITLKSSNNRVEGNFIGTDASGIGTLATDNKNAGVRVGDFSGSTPIYSGNIIGGTNLADRNLLTGNAFGVQLDEQSSGTLIFGNLIGLNKDGNTSHGNFQSGIADSGSSNTQIGNGSPNGRNVISGNTNAGILQGNGTGIQIRGNYIGTNAAGSAALGNANAGVEIIYGGSNGLIEGNVISGNGADGVSLGSSVGDGSAANFNVRSNFIGTNPTGMQAIPNAGAGVAFYQFAAGHTIGGTGGGQGNVIAFNGGPGIEAFGGGAGNRFLGNSISKNGGLGINHGGTTENYFGVTLNDSPDVDGVTNWPQLQTASNSGSSISLNGVLNAQANRMYRVEFFALAPDQADSSGYGEGAVYLGFQDVTSNGTGVATITYSQTISLPGNTVFSATATPALSGSSSEFGPVAGASTTYTWVGTAATDWFNPSNWTPNGVPGVLDIANIGSGSVVPTSPVSVKALNFTGGSLGGTSEVNVLGTLAWTGGTHLDGTLRVIDGATATIGGSSSPVVWTNGTLENHGSLTVQAQGVNFNQGVLTNASPGALMTLLAAVNDADGGATAVSLSNQGTIQKQGAGAFGFGGFSVSNAGTLRSQAGTLSVGAIQQTAGLTELAGGSITSAGTVQILGGDLVGAGTITGNVQNDSRIFIAGKDAAGTLTIAGNYTQFSNGVLVVDLGGLTPGTGHDKLTVTGSATLSGTLETNLLGTFVVRAGNSFNILAGSPVSGTFLNRVGAPPIPVSYTAAAVTLNAVGFTVTNTNDSGAGSLRQAILDANAQSGLDFISFNIPGGGLKTIAPLTVLPALGDDTVLDAYSQPGASVNTLAVGSNAVLLVELNGASVPNGAGDENALSVSSNKSTISGFIINRWMGYGVAIAPDGGGSAIVGNWIGPDSTGSAAPVNSQSGILIESAPDVRIGSAAPRDRNVISGNGGTGIAINGSASDGTIIRGNYIGTTKSGAALLGNTFDGIVTQGPNTLVGGDKQGEGNVISGALSGVGVLINLASASGSSVMGNLIGADASGTLDFGNGNSGITINAAPSVTIGGLSPGAGNVIVGNGSAGIFIVGAAATGAVLEGNFIGTDKTGALSLGNDDSGILIFQASGVVVGGLQTGAGNVIANNIFRGIDVDTGGAAAAGNMIRGNAMYGNGALGIDLVAAGDLPNGVTPNDALDADTGANGLVNFPTLTTFISGANPTVTGTYSGLASSSFEIDVYSSDAADPSGNGEGRFFLGTVFVTTNASGTATFTVPLSGFIPPGGVLTATATHTGTGSTSEFSPALATVVSNIRTWDAGGGADTNWFNAVNWTGDVVPGPADTAELLSNFTVTLNAPVNIANFTQTTGTVTGGGNMTIGNSFTWSGGTQSGVGTLIIGAGATATLSGTAQKPLDRRFIENNGTFTFTGTGNLSLINGPAITNNGIWDFASDADIRQDDAIGSLFKNSDGATLRKSIGAGGGATVLGLGNQNLVFENNGAIEVLAGTLTVFSSGGVWAGSPGIVTSAGTVFGFTGGGFTWNVAPVLSGSGTLDVGGSANVTLAGGTTLTVPAGLALSLSGSGVLAGTGALVVNGAFNFLAGTHGGTGTTTIGSGGTLTLTGGGAKNLAGRMLVNDGTVTHNSTGDLRLANGVAIANNGLWDIQTDADLFNDDATAKSFTNTGTFRKSGGTAVTIISETNDPSLSFINSGALEVHAGRVELRAGGSWTGGDASIVAGAGLDLINATIIFSDGAALSGSGQFVVDNSSTLSLAPLYTLNVPATLDFRLDGGTITGAGDLVIPGTLFWANGTMSGTGKTTIQAAATATLDSLFSRSINQRTFDNFGTVFHANLGSIDLNNGATFNNRGLYELQSNASFGSADNTAKTLHNFAGAIIRKNGGTGTTTWFSSTDIVFTNEGAIEVLTGTLSADLDSVWTNASAAVSSGATLRLAGTATTLNGTTSLNGTGTTELGLSSATTIAAGGEVNVAVGHTLLTSTASVLTGAGTLNVNGTFHAAGGTMSGAGVTNIAAGGTLNITATTQLDGRTMSNLGAVNFTAAQFRLLNGATVNNSGVWQFQGDNNISALSGGGTFNNTAAGVVAKVAGTGTAAFNAPNVVTNQGLIESQSGTMAFNNGLTQSGTGSAALALAGGSFAGTTITIAAGEVRGTGSIAANLTNSGGTVRPGGTGAAGTMTVTGNYVQGAGGTLGAELGGVGAGQFDVLSVTGSASIDGLLNVAFFNGYVPVFGDTLTIVPSAARSGTFASISGAGLLTAAYTATEARLVRNAVSFAWDGGAGNSDWFTPQNWNPDFVPTASDDVSLMINSTINLPSNVSVASYTQSTGSLNGAGNLTVTTAFNWTGGQLDSGGGKLILPSGSVANLSSGPWDLRRTVDQAGTLTISSGADLTLSSGAVFNNIGLVVSTGTGFTIDARSGGGGSFRNLAGGTFRVTGTGQEMLGGSFDNNGTVDLSIGADFRLGTAVTGSSTGGMWSLASGSQFTFDHSGTTYSLSNATFSGAGTVRVQSTAGLGFPAATTTNFNSVIFSQTGGSLVGPGTATMAGATSLTNTGITGGITLNVGGTLANLNGGLAGGSTFNTSGTSTFSGGFSLAEASVLNNSGALTIPNGAVADFITGSGGGSIVNASVGSFTKLPSANNTAIQVPFANSGAVSIEGSMTFTTFTQSGTAASIVVTGATSGAWQLNGGTFSGTGTHSTGSVTNAGATIRPGGLNTVGTLHVNNYEQLAGGTLEIEITGTGAGQFDVLDLTGASTLGGGLSVDLVAPFNPTAGNTFRVVTGGPSGNFATFTGDVAALTRTVDASGVLLTSTALTYVWDAGAGGDTSWFNALNWNLDSGIPGPGDTAILNIASTISLSTNTSVGTFQQSGGTFTSPTGVTFTVLNAFDWTGGTQSGAGTARTTLPAGSNSTFGGAAVKTIAGRAFNVGGTLTWSGTGDIALNSGNFLVQSGGVFDLQSDALLGDADGSATAAGLFVTGLLKKSAGTGTSALGGNLGSGNGTFAVQVNTVGVLRVESGTVRFDGALHNIGNVDALTNTVVLTTGNGIERGTFHTDAGGVVRVTGGVQTFDPGAAITGGGLFEIAGGRVDAGSITLTNLAVAPGSVLNAAFGITQSFTWTGGTMSGSLYLTPGSASAISGAATKTWTSGSFQVDGTLAWSGTGTLDFAGPGGLTVGMGGLFDLQSDATFGNSAAGFTTSFIIDGTLRKSGGAGTSRIDGTPGAVAAFVSGTGRLEALGGTLAIGDSFGNVGTVSALGGTIEIAALADTDTGNYNAAAGARVLFSGGARTLDPGATLTGSGLFEVTGGGLILNTNISVANLALHGPAGGVAGSGNLTITNSLDWTSGTMSGGTTTVAAGATLALSGAAQKTLGSALIVIGSAAFAGTGNLAFSGGAGIVNRGLFDIQTDADFIALDVSQKTFTNVAGAVLRKSAGAGVTTFPNTPGAVEVNDSGAIQVQSGTIELRGESTHTNGSFTISPGATLALRQFNHEFFGTTAITGGGTLIADTPASGLNGTVNVTGAGTTLQINDGASSGTLNIGTGSRLVLDGDFLTGNGLTISVSGTFDWLRGDIGAFGSPGAVNISSGGVLNIAGAAAHTTENDVAINNAGTVAIANPGSVTLQGGFTQTAGQTLLTGTIVGSSFTFSGGSLSTAGVATITGGLSNTGAIFRPGDTGVAATLTVNGNYTQGVGGTLEVELGGFGAGQFDRIDVSGTATLDGTLIVADINGFTPAIGSTFRVVQSAGNPGTFQNLGGTIAGLLQQADGTGLELVVAPGQMFVWDDEAGDGDWFNPLNWDLDSGVPSTADTAVLSTATSIILNSNASISAFIQSAGTFTGGATLSVANGLTWSGGVIGLGIVTAAGSVNTLGGTAVMTLDSALLELDGATTFGGTFPISLAGTGAEIRNIGAFEFASSAGIDGTGIFHNFSGSSGVTKSGASETIIGVEFANGASLAVNGGTLSLAAGGSWLSGLSVTVASSSVLNFSGGTHDMPGSHSIAGAGRTRLSGGVLDIYGTTFTVVSGHTFELLSGGTLDGDADLMIDGAFNWLGGTMMGFGETKIQTGGAATVTGLDAKNLDSRTLTVDAGATLDVTGDGTLQFFNGAAILVDGALTISSAAPFLNGGGSLSSIEIRSVGTFDKTGTGFVDLDVPFVNAGSATFSGGLVDFRATYTQTSGFTALAGGVVGFSNPAEFQGGTLRGSGDITGSVNNTGAIVSPGNSPGQFVIEGDYVQGPSGLLRIEIQGSSPGAYDALMISGSASIDGDLEVTVGGIIPLPGQTFTFINAASVSGTFSSVTLPSTLKTIYAANAVSVRAPFLPPGLIRLSDLNGTDGFAIPGLNVGGNTGASVAGLGDINGDGLGDFVIGAPGEALGGVSYVIFGTADPLVTPFDLSTLNGTNGFSIVGGANSSRSGFSVSSLGDLNGDGVNEILVGDPESGGAGGNVAAAYVVFGKTTAFTSTVDLSLLDGTNGFRMVGVVTAGGDRISVASAGDLNNDGATDIIIGMPDADFNGTDSGVIYVVFGIGDPQVQYAPSFDLAVLDGTNGFRILGQAEGDAFGAAVSTARDINRDGFGDIIIGAPKADGIAGADSGAAYVLFGKNDGYSATIDLASLNGKTGFKIEGKAAGEKLGSSVSSAGDVNGDGFGDIVVGAVDASKSGVAYVGFGKARGFKPVLDLSKLTGANGFRLTTASVAGTNVAPSVGSVGDFNNDGFDDILIGTPLPDGGAGVTYLMFGRSNGFAPELNLETLNATTGFRFAGAVVNGQSGASVSGGTDLNNDGFDDIIIGAPERGTESSPVGKGGAYVIYGHATRSIPTVSASGTSATFSDVDGDIITVKVTGGKITADMLVFGPDGGLLLVDLTAADTLRDGANLTFSVRPFGGNGTVNVGAIDAEGLRLGSVKVTGDLGQIDAGKGDPLKPALKSLTVGSLGALGDTTQIPGTEDPLVSDLMGSLPKVTVKGNFTNATFNVLGKLGSMTVNGAFSGTGAFSSSQLAGLAALGHEQIGQVAGGTTLASSGLSAGSIGSLNIKGGVTNSAINSASGIGSASITGDFNRSAIVAATSVGVVKVVGKLIGDATTPSVISARGKLIPKSQGASIAINSLTVKGDVEYAEILMGYDRTFTALNGDASIGKVTVNGNWKASSLVAGIKDETNNGFGLDDLPIPGFDATAKVFSRIASLIIKGTAEGSAGAGDSYAITAQQIIKAKIHGSAVPLDKLLPDNRLLEGTDDFRLVEVI